MKSWQGPWKHSYSFSPQAELILHTPPEVNLVNYLLISVLKRIYSVIIICDNIYLLYLDACLISSHIIYDNTKTIVLLNFKLYEKLN